MPDAHTENITHKYTIRFPAHDPRETDRHYKLFEELRRQLEGTPDWRCLVAFWHDDESECAPGPLEVHHATIEFAVQNEVDLSLIHKDYPDVTDAESLARFVEGNRLNFQILCSRHHRGDAGVHILSGADWAAQRYVRGFVVKPS